MSTDQTAYLQEIQDAANQISARLRRAADNAGGIAILAETAIREIACHEPDAVQGFHKAVNDGASAQEIRKNVAAVVKELGPALDEALYGLSELRREESTR
jgi:hypothetical protein